MSLPPNPYQTTEISSDGISHTNDDGGWVVRSGLLYCEPTAVLPEICYSTLATENLVPYDTKLKYSSPIVAGVLVLACGAMWLINRFVDSLAVNLTGGAILLGLFMFDRVASKSIRLRMYESQGIRNARRKKAMWSWIVVGGAGFTGLVLFLEMMDSDVSSSVILVVFFLVAIAGLFGPNLIPKGPKAPTLDAIEHEAGLFLIDGLSPEFVSAVADRQAGSRAETH